MAKIIDHLATLTASKKPFPANSLQPIFVGKSANNASFLAAVLKDQSILHAEPTGLRFHTVSERVHEWQDVLLTLWNTSQSTANSQKSHEPSKASSPRRVRNAHTLNVIRLVRIAHPTVYF